MIDPKIRYLYYLYLGYSNVKDYQEQREMDAVFADVYTKYICNTKSDILDRYIFELESDK